MRVIYLSLCVFGLAMAIESVNRRSPVFSCVFGLLSGFGLFMALGTERAE